MKKIIFIALIAAMFATSCTKEDDTPINSNETTELTTKSSSLSVNCIGLSVYNKLGLQNSTSLINALRNANTLTGDTAFAIIEKSLGTRRIKFEIIGHSLNDYERLNAMFNPTKISKYSYNVTNKKTTQWTSQNYLDGYDFYNIQITIKWNTSNKVTSVEYKSVQRYMSPAEEMTNSHGTTMYKKGEILTTNAVKK